MAKYKISDIVRFQPYDTNHETYYLILDIKYNSYEGDVHPFNYIYMDLTTGAIYQTQYYNVHNFQKITNLVD